MPVNITTVGQNLSQLFPASVGSVVSLVAGPTGSAFLRYAVQPVAQGQPMTTWPAGVVSSGSLASTDITQSPMLVQLVSQGGGPHRLLISDPDAENLIPDPHWKSQNTSFASSAVNSSFSIPVVIASGGTNATTAPAALINLLPGTSGATNWAFAVNTTGTPSFSFYHGYQEVCTGLDTAGFKQSIANATSRANARVTIVPGQTYTFTSTVAINTAGGSPGKALRMKCEGQAVFDMSALNSTQAGIQWQGTSGPGGIQDEINGVYFSGAGVANGCIAVELISMDGARIRRCHFQGLFSGVLFANIGGGAGGPFTEDCCVEDCFFDSDVGQWLEYRNIGGASSFHGSCMLGQSVGNLGDGTNSLTINSGSQAYNCELNCIVFYTNTTGGGTFINNQSALKSNFSGGVRFEGANRRQTLSFCDPNAITYSGWVHSNGPTIGMGNCGLIGDVVLNADGTFSSDGQRLRIQYNNYNFGTGLFSIAGSYDVTVTIRRETLGDYDVRHAFVAMSDDYGGSGYLSAGATSALKAVTTGAASTYGLPTYQISPAGVLFVSSNTGGLNVPASTMTLYLDAQQRSQKLNYTPITGFTRINDQAIWACTSSDVVTSGANTITFQGGVGLTTNARVRFTVQQGTLTGLTSGNYYFISSVSAALSTYTFADSFFPPVGTGTAKAITAVSNNLIGTLFTY